MTKKLLLLLAAVMFLMTSCDWFKDPVDLDQALCFKAIEPGACVKLSGSKLFGSFSFKYSLDGEHWQTLEPDETTVTLSNVGDKVYIYGNNPDGFDIVDNIHFVMGDKKIAASGNVMSLINGAVVPTEIPTEYCFSELFKNCTSLTAAPRLGAQKLTAHCYEDMFYGCTNLTSAPQLPATKLEKYCYYEMFAGCTSLTTAPELPATELAESCYSLMFWNCPNLHSIKVHFTQWMSNYGTSLWVFDVASDGTFSCPSSLEQKFGSSNIPDGWTVQTF